MKTRIRLVLRRKRKKERIGRWMDLWIDGKIDKERHLNLI
jgi:hypothetical protein